MREPRSSRTTLSERRITQAYPHGPRWLTFVVMVGLLAQLLIPVFGFSAAALAQDGTPAAADATAPVVTVPADLTAVADASGTAAVTFDVAASDDVDGPLTPSCDWASGAAFPVGDTVVTCTATDAAGNQGSASFTISVGAAPDTTAPVVSVPGNLTATADESGAAVVTFDASATDDVGVVNLSCDWPSGSAFPVGDTVVTCTASDAAGNQGSVSFTVSVSAAPAPTATDTPAPAPTNTPTPAPTAPPAITTPPTVSSDKADYAPGELVTLTGGNWQPGEQVHIYVNDDFGSSWSRNVDVIADADGNITDSFNLPNWFVATYSVKATGPLSGSATMRFTDAITIRFNGTDSNEHTTAITEENLGSVGIGTGAINLTCPRGTGLTVRATGLGGGQTSLWTVSFVNGAGNNAALSTRTTLSPVSGTFGSGSSGNDNFCIAMSVDASTLSAGTYHGQLRLAATDAGNPTRDYFYTFTVVGKQNQTITFTSTAPNPATYGDTYTPTATGGGSGNPVTFGASGACAYSGGIVTMTGVGTCTVTADQAGNANYNPAPQASQQFSVVAKSVTGAFTVGNKVYDGTTTAAIASRSLSGVVSGDDVSLTGGAATFADKNVGNGKTVTGTGFSLTGAKAANYTLASTTLTTTANITAATLTVSFTAGNKVYDGTTAATITGRTLTGVVSGDTVSVGGGAATFADANVGTGKTVTASGFTLSGANAGNYVISSAPITTAANITAKSVTGSFTAENKVYDGTASATVTGRSLNGVVGEDKVALTGGTATFNTKDVGNGKVVTLSSATLGGTDAGNYTLESVNTSTANITAKGLTGSFTASDKVYDGNIDATIITRLAHGAVSGEDVSLTGGSATFSDKNVGTGKTVTGAGFTLGGTDAGNYTLTSVATTTASITARPIQVTAIHQTKTYGDADPELSYSITSQLGLATGDSFSGSLTRVSGENAGTYMIQQGTLALSTNYTLTFAENTLTIFQKQLLVNANAQSKTYGGDDPALTWTYSGFIPGENAGNVTITGAANCAIASDAGPNVGVYAGAITCTPGDLTATNYSFATGSAGTLTIGQAVLTVTADNTSKVYGQANPDFTVSYHGFVNGDDANDLGGALSFSTDVTATSGVGSYDVTPGGLTSDNYAITFAKGALSVTPKPVTVTANNDWKIYGADDPDFTYSVSGLVPGDSLTGVTCGIAGAHATVRDYDITCAGNTNPNYDATYKAGTFSVYAKPITGSFTAANKVYDGAASATVTGRSLNGVVGEDQVALTGGTATFADENVGLHKTVTLSGATLDGTDAGNYSLTSVATAQADITAKELTGSFTASNKVYDGNTDATVATSSLPGVINGNVVTLDVTNARFDTKNVGTGKTVTADLALSGADAGNYSLSATTATAKADITALVITGSFTAKDKAYDGNSVATVLTRSLNGTIATDNVTLTGGSAAFDNKNVGVGKTVTLTGAALGGNDASNYTLDSVNTTTAAITARTLTVTATAGNKVYDGAATASVSLADDRVAGDELSIDYTSATFSSADAGTGKTVTVHGIEISGGVDAGNYTLGNATATATADITPRPIEVTADGKTKVYGDADPALTYHVSSSALVPGDAFTGSLNRVAGEDVGSYGITRGNLALSNNYVLTYVGANLEITKAQLTVTADNASRVYGAANPTFTAHYSGFKFNQTLATSGVTGNPALATAATAASTVGDYPITANVGTLTAHNYNFSLLDGTLTITQATLTVTASDQSRVYGGPNPANLTYAITGFVNDETENVVSGVPSLSIAATATDTAPAGSTHVITISVDDLSADNYRFVGVNGTLTITKAGTLTDAADKSATYGMASVTLTATVSAITPSTAYVNGGTVKFTVTDSQGTEVGTAVTDTTIADGVASATFMLAGVNAGNYNILAEYSGADNFTLSSNAGDLRILAIAKATPVITWSNPAAITYGTALGGAQLNATANVTGSFVYTPAAGTVLNAGTHTLSVAFTPTDPTNYTGASATVSLTVNAKAATVTANNASKTYGGADPGFGYSASGLLDGDALTGVICGVAGAHASAGSYTITCAGNTNLNYDVTYVAGTLTVNPKPITGAFTVANKTYDGATTATIVSHSLDENEVVGEDEVGLAGGTATFDTKDVGTGKTVTGTGFALSGSAKDNYILVSSTLTTTADIEPKVLIGSFTANNKVYDGNRVASVHTTSLLGVVNEEAVTLAVTNALFDTKNVGTGKAVAADLALSGGGAANYQLSKTTATTMADITARPLTVTATAEDKVYNGTSNATVGLSDDHVYGDALSVLYTSATFDDPNVGTGKTVTVSGIEISGGADAGNYSLSATSVTAKADITPLQITGTFKADNKIYDSTNAATISSRSLTGVVDTDDVSLTGGTATFADANVGNGKTVTGIGFSLAGAKAANYTLTSSTLTAAANITAATVIVSFSAADKVYDGATAATITGRTLTGVISGDTVSVGGGTATFADAKVGTGKTVTGSGFTLSGADAGNYVISSASITTTATITAKSVTGSFTAENKVYDGTTSATIASRTLDGAITGDDVTLSGGTATFGTKDVGTGKTVTATDFALSGADKGNYTLVSSTLTAKADITARPITVKADDKTKVVGATDPALTYQITSGSLVGTDAFTGSLTRTAGENAGAYLINQGTLRLSSNYTLTFTGGSLMITYSTVCNGGSGGVILQPVNADGTSVFKQGSTVPLKFQVCDANGNSVGTTGTVKSFKLVSTTAGTVSGVNETPISTTPYTEFRWDSTSQQWIFNLSTKTLKAGNTYTYEITLADNSVIRVTFGLK